MGVGRQIDPVCSRGLRPWQNHLSSDGSPSGGFLALTGDLLAQYSIDAGPPDTQFAGDLRGPDAIGLQAHDLPLCACRLAVGTRPLYPPLRLRSRNARALTLQHGLTLGLTDRPDDGEHQASSARGGVEGLAAGDRQNPQRHLLRFQPGDDRQQISDRPSVRYSSAIAARGGSAGMERALICSTATARSCEVRSS